MIAAALVAVLGAAPLGACADRAACRFTTADAALQEALTGLGLTVGELKAAPLKRPGGDLAFSLSAALTGQTVVVKAVSLQRPATIWGEGTARVLPVEKPQWKDRALRSAYKVAVPKALEDLRARIEGRRKLTLSLKVSGLDAKTRDHAEKSVLPCLKALYELVGPVTTPEVSGGYLNEAIEYLPEKDEPREPLLWQVGRVREAMLGGIRSKCSVAGTPLQGWSTRVAADELNGAVVVSFSR